MKSQTIIEFGLLGLIAIETSFLAYKSARQLSRHSKFDHPIFVDTSVLMDGRILGVAKTGFITGELVVPRSVILELQLLADKSDHEKRERARYGLDVVAKLQALDSVRVRMYHDTKATQGVDERLLELARGSDGIVLTLDFNLQKVAATEGIKVLNLNELAQTLRIERLPGERLSLALVEKGSDSHQAVGYLPDGTMVVVEHASGKIGQTETIEIIRSLQTAAGRMCFAKLVAADSIKLSKDEKTNVQKRLLGRRPVKQASAQTVESSIEKSTVKAIPKPQRQKASKTARGAQTQVSDKAANRPSTRSNGITSKPEVQKPSQRPKTSKQREASLLRAIEDSAE